MTFTRVPHLVWTPTGPFESCLSTFWSLKHASERAKARCLSIETLAPHHTVMGQSFVQ